MCKIRTMTLFLLFTYLGVKIKHQSIGENYWNKLALKVHSMLIEH